MTGLLRSTVGLNSVIPRYMTKTAFDLILQSVETFKPVVSATGHNLLWQEFQNKLEVFNLFQHVDLVLGIPSNTPLDLCEMSARASELGPFFSPWAMEGLGHYYTFCRNPNLAGGRIFEYDAWQFLPQKDPLPLHTGMGLALAEIVLARRQDSATSAEMFVQLCRDNARPEMLGATIEALGLVVRNLYPELLEPLSQYFSGSNQELFEYFWHGVGRGIYFSPVNFLPYWKTPWQGYETCLREPPNDVARRNAMAGFTWAATLVNLRHPSILASFSKQYAGTLAANDAFANGIFSALVIWLSCAPNDSSVASLLAYQPDWSERSLYQLWETQVRKTGEAALHFRPDTVNGLGGLFRYRPLSTLTTFSARL